MDKTSFDRMFRRPSAPQWIIDDSTVMERHIVVGDNDKTIIVNERLREAQDIADKIYIDCDNPVKTDIVITDAAGKIQSRKHWYGADCDPEYTLWVRENYED